MQKVHFWLTCMAQKRRCLNSLFNEARHKNENHKTRFDKALFHESYYL